MSHRRRLRRNRRARARVPNVSPSPTSRAPRSDTPFFFPVNTKFRSLNTVTGARFPSCSPASFSFPLTVCAPLPPVIGSCFPSIIAAFPLRVW